MASSSCENPGSSGVNFNHALMSCLALLAAVPVSGLVSTIFAVTKASHATLISPTVKLFCPVPLMRRPSSVYLGISRSGSRSEGTFTGSVGCGLVALAALASAAAAFNNSLVRSGSLPGPAGLVAAFFGAGLVLR